VGPSFATRNGRKSEGQVAPGVVAPDTGAVAPVGWIVGWTRSIAILLSLLAGTAVPMATCWLKDVLTLPDLCTTVEHFVAGDGLL
jgi:hypothetical protein